MIVHFRKLLQTGLVNQSIVLIIVLLMEPAHLVYVPVILDILPMIVLFQLFNVSITVTQMDSVIMGSVSVISDIQEWTVGL
jgi:hypothetical protein